MSQQKTFFFTLCFRFHSSLTSVASFEATNEGDKERKSDQMDIIVHCVHDEHYANSFCLHNLSCPSTSLSLSIRPPCDLDLFASKDNTWNMTMRWINLRATKQNAFNVRLIFFWPIFICFFFVTYFIRCSFELRQRTGVTSSRFIEYFDDLKFSECCFAIL